MEEFFFKGQRKIIRKKLIKASICFLIIGIFIGVGIGQYWRMKQVEPEYQGHIVELQKRIDFYRENFVPIKPDLNSIMRNEKNKRKN